MSLLSISYVLKNRCFPIILHSFLPLQFLKTFPTPSPSSHFFPSPILVFTNFIRNLKPSLIYKLSLVALFSAVMLCLQQLPFVLWNSFFDVLPCAPTNTGMNSNASNVPHSFDNSI